MSLASILAEPLIAPEHCTVGRTIDLSSVPTVAPAIMAYAPRILIVEDEPNVRQFFERVLAEDGYNVTSVATGRQALFAVRHAECEVVIADMSLPDLDGPSVIRVMMSEFPHLKIIAVSGSMEAQLIGFARMAGAMATFAKPVDPMQLRAQVYAALDPSRAWKAR